jgi:hypothetical protein
MEVLLVGYLTTRSASALCSVDDSINEGPAIGEIRIGRETIALGENSSQCHFFRHKPNKT